VRLPRITTPLPRRAIDAFTRSGEPNPPNPSGRRGRPLGAAGASALGAGFSRLGGGWVAAEHGEAGCTSEGAELRYPEVWERTNGLLTVELIAMDDKSRELGAVGYAGGGVGFTGLVPEPILRLFPGDRLRLRGSTPTSAPSTASRAPA